MFDRQPPLCPADLAGMPNPASASRRRSAALRRLLLAGGLLIGILALAVPSAFAASTPTVNLGHASTYAVLSGTSVGNTVSAPGAPFTTLRGDLGVNANTQPTGFPPGVVTGTIRVGSTATPGYNDLVTAYNEVAARPAGAALAGDLAGLTLSPGLHSTAAAVANTGTVTLDGGGDPNAVFVFQIGGAMTMAAGAQVKLTNGASASHIFWQVNGAAAIGAGDTFAGTLMALNAIAVGAGSEVNGRAMSLGGAISLSSNEFYSAPPVVTISGGATKTTNDSTPTIGGTTDIQAPAVVTLTIGGKTLKATPSAGAWSATSALLANGTYSAVASVADGAGNTASATQQLTVDTVPPVLTLTGGTSVLTNNPTPTIAGQTDIAVGGAVHVTVASQTLTAFVETGGTWNVRVAALTDGAHAVTASVTDPAGNSSTASQTITVDTHSPTLTLIGGSHRLTDQRAPVISGSAAVPSGTTVTVALADQTLTAKTNSTGAWSVTSAALADGAHRVTVSVSDPAGNRSNVVQMLRVDTVAPVIAIAGGATVGTYDLDPTIMGTSGAVPGTTVTVTVASQTMTTLLQPNHTWNATPKPLGEGTWAVTASASDPAGNVGIARQSLTTSSPAAVTSLTPASGPTGTHVSITGHGFRSTSTVTFNGVAATILSRVLPSKLIAVVPATATSGKITVANAGAPINSAVSANAYTVTAHTAPTIRSFTPASGSTGASVTITGTFFSGASSVTFGTLPASYVIVSATQITATVPNGASTGKISVTTAVATATSSTSFTPTLSITFLTPATGPTGTHVTVFGVGFTSTSTVKFNGVAAVILSRALPTELVAVVPAGATSGKITVTNTGAPSGTVSSASSFTKT